MASLRESYMNYEQERLKDYVKAIDSKINQQNATLGVKYDFAKPKWSLLPWDEVEDVVKVLTFGAKKYAPDNWKFVDDADNRYMDATLRHLVAYRQGERRDAESGESHIAHALCCLLFMLWHDKHDKNDNAS